MILRAIRWSIVSAALNLIAQVGIMAMLSRLLKPDDFGLYASAGLAMRFITYFAQMGMGPAIIQRLTLGVNTRKTSLFGAALIGLLAWVVLAAFSIPVAAFFKDQRLLSLLPVIGFTLFLGGLSSVPLALLRRDLDFRHLAGIEVCSLLFGYGGTSLICAYSGLGVWSLVAGTLAQEVILVVGGLIYSRGIWLGRIEFGELRVLWNYGSRHSLVGFMDFISSNVETLFIGRVLGSASLGIFNRSQAVTSLPIELLMSAVGRVIFPAFSSARAQPGRLGAGFIVALQGNLLFAMPISFGMAAAASQLVTVILGSSWNAAAPVAAVFAYSIPWLHVSTVCGITMDAAGEFKKKGSMIVLITLVKIGLMAGLSGFGLRGIALAMVIGEMARAVAALAIARRLANVSWRVIGVIFVRAFSVAIPVWLAITSLVWVANDISVSPLLALVTEIAVAALLFLAIGRWQLLNTLRDPDVQPVESELAGLRRVLRAV